MDSKKAVKQLNELKKLGGSMRLAAEGWESDFQTLIATALSARSLDETTIKHATILFNKYPDAEKLSKAKLKKAKIKVNVAILGGGDVIFPIIAAGVMLKTIGYISVGSIILPIASFFIILGAGLGLGYLFFAAEKKKFYPAMPFITAGILLGMLVYWLVF